MIYKCVVAFFFGWTILPSLVHGQESQYNPASIDSLTKSTKSSGESGFGWIYHHSEKIDSVMNSKTYAQAFLDYIIAKEEIDPHLWGKDGKEIAAMPDWKAMKSVIQRKYSAVYAARTVVDAQIRWYNYKKDSFQLMKAQVEKMDKLGLDTLGFGRANINNIVYYLILRYSDDAVILRKAIRWMEVVISIDSNDANFLDTYANILYKAGRKKDAIRWESKAEGLDAVLAVKENRSPNKEFSQTLMKMTQGLPTWKG